MARSQLVIVYKDAFDRQMQEAIPDFYAMAHPCGEGGNQWRHRRSYG